MSTKYTGGFITKSPVAPTTSAASGIWTLDQQQQAQKAGTWPSPPIFIEDLFSTYLYTGTGANGLQIQNGIDLANKGGLVIGKARSGTEAGTVDFGLVDTTRGGSSVLSSNSPSGAQATAQISSFNSNGFTLNGEFPLNYYGSPYTYASWTFAKQPKFFDVVTYTGTGSARTITHNLGSAPGCIIVKRTNDTGNWQVYHQSLGATQYVVLNSTLAAATSSDRWNNTAPTSSVFTVGVSSTVNGSGATYVAYLFAHNAGGFGLSGSENVISCGSFTTDGSGNASVTLGYEPQFVMWKKSSASGAWNMQDVMRGMPVTGDGQFLEANASDAEYGASQPIRPNATGFYGALTSNASSTYIYIAIRRGPMKVPTSGTSVFGLSARTGTGSNATVTGSAGVSDAVLIKNRGSAVASLFSSRLTGTGYLVTSTTAVEVAAGATILQANPWDVMDGVKVGTTSTITNASANTYINYLFDRAPGFFDEVCYTGTGVARTVTHNLTVAPELLIVKDRTPGGNEWAVYASPLGNLSALSLNRNYAAGPTAIWNSTTPTSSVFSVSDAGDVNGLNYTLVAYLFATVLGVSKVGSYTGTGALLTVNCGFTTGARFVLIKRTDDTGSWYVWDSARGITVGNDPYLLLNSTAAEVTGTNYVDTDTTGFQVTAAAPAEINASGGTYIFLAIA